MKPNVLLADDRAVSPVVGVALLIAITVILAAVIGAVVLGLGTGGVDTPQAQLQAQYDADEENVTIEHNGGEPLPDDTVTIVIDGDDYNISDDGDFSEGDELTAGNSVSLGDGDVDEDSEVTVLWEDPNSDSETVLEEFEL